MLDPNKQRQSFLDVLRPPPGYRLTAGIGTTYSLELEPLTAALLAFIGEDFDPEAPDRAAIIHALSRLSHCLRIYVNAGCMPAASSRLSRLFALYDGFVRQLSLADAAFHPKLWVLKFEPPNTPEHRRSDTVYRLLCASRNLTSSRFWELGACVEGTLEEEKQGGVGASAASLGELLLAARGENKPPAPIAKLLAELPRVRFEAGREMRESLELRWQWPGRAALHTALPASGARALLISPFLRARFVDLLAQRFGKLTILGNQEELDALPDATHARLDPQRLFVLAPAAANDPLQGLHAKLLLCESAGGPQAFLGSANGSGAAWGLENVINCEAMLDMKPGPGLDAVMRDLILDPKRGVPHPWTSRYERQPILEDERERTRKQLEALRRQLAQLRLRATYDTAARTLALVCTNAELARLPEGFSCEVAPYLLTERAAAFRPLRDLVEGTVRYEDVPVDSLCEFTTVRVTAPEFDLSHEFLLQLDGLLSPELREARDDELMRRMLDGGEFRAMLLRLLGSAPRSGGKRGDGGGGGGAWQPLLRELTLERALEACAAETERVQIIDALLRAMSRSGAVDDSFLEFWRNLKEAMAMVGGGRRG